MPDKDRTRTLTSSGDTVKQQINTQNTAGLGTFIGVFTPTLLTILGVIMYLRFGWMVGHLGLLLALVVVLLGNAITFCTALSFSSIATNTQVGGGGAYYMISRSLGLEVGGAIGIPLFLSQALSVTLYAFGLAETLRFVWADLPLEPTVFVIIVAVGMLSFKGADMALKAQIPILFLVGISILALVSGAVSIGTNNHLPMITQAAVESSKNVGFWTVFAVFFPAVTGVMAGLGLSGDLKDPRTSIPKGSLLAALCGAAVYIVVVVALAFSADSASLQNDPMVWSKIAPMGALFILPGLWGAIFSSAVGSMLGAPRTLQAMAQDHLSEGSILKIFAGNNNETPIAGMAFSIILALAAVFLGDLNAVAEVVSMFFLTVYGAVNLVAALGTLSGDSSWRPTLRIHWVVSVAGALGCFAVMFLINATAGVIALTVEALLWLVFARLERHAEWGDMRRDLYEALIRWALIRLRRRPMSARNWRPHILVFTHKLEERIDLVRYGDWFSQGRGVVTVCELMVGDLGAKEVNPHARRTEIDTILESHGIVAFGEVDVVANIEQGITEVVQANGLAGLESNTVLIGWRKESERLAEFLTILPQLETLHKSVIISRHLEAKHIRPSQSRQRRIDIWWGGVQRNGDLMLLLAHMLTRNPLWRGAQIKIWSIASNDLTKKDTQNRLDHLLPEARIEATTEIILKTPDKSVREIIRHASADADLVFLGLASPAPDQTLAYAQRMQEMVNGLPSVCFVKNNSLFIGELV